MSSYVVTVAPQDEPELATVVAHVSVSKNGGRVTRVELDAGEGRSLASVPAVDVEMLLRAVEPATTGSRSSGGSRARRGGGRRTAAGRAKRTAAPAKKARRSAERSSAARGGGRPYRTAPDDLVEVFEELGRSPSAVAGHYGVPVYTVNGWVRRLRREGALA